MTPSEEKLWATLCHLSAIVGYLLIPLGNIFGPLLVWLLKKDQSSLVNDQGKEALNFQISITIYMAVVLAAGIAFWRIVPHFPGALATALYLFGVVMTIVASVKANQGIAYRYPFTIRFIQ
jgi:hypothetical protein